MGNKNIPIYRAEIQDNKINLDKIEQYTELINGKRYAIGLLSGKGRHIEVTKGDTTTFLIIDSTTLSIHFPNMLDSQGNKIFASLSEDGKGGDIIEDTLINFDYDEYIIKGYLFFDNPSKAIFIHNFFERTKKKNEPFASEHRPKIKYTNYQSLLRPKTIGIQEWKKKNLLKNGK